MAQGQYRCKIATLEEVIEKMDYEISIHTNPIWREFKERAVHNFKQGNSIVYVGILDGRIICEATAIVKQEGFAGDIDQPDCLLTEEQVYLSAFRTIKEFEGQGYFSQLFRFMEADLKQRGYRKMSLGVEPCEVRNIQIYFHWGFTNYLKTTLEPLPPAEREPGREEQAINYYYKDI